MSEDPTQQNPAETQSWHRVEQSLVPTPLTDSAAKNYWLRYGTQLAVESEFARTLERELAQSNALNAKARVAIDRSLELAQENQMLRMAVKVGTL